MTLPNTATGDITARPTMRTPWSLPRVTRLDAASAENSLNPIRSDGVFSMGS